MFNALESSSTTTSSADAANIDFFTGFDMSDADLDMLEDIFLKDEIKAKDMFPEDDFVDSDAHDLLDFFGKKDDPDTIKPDLVRVKFDAFSIKTKKRKIEVPLLTTHEPSNNYSIYTQDKVVMLRCDNRNIIIGKSKKHFDEFNVDKIDYISKASIVSEETLTKGTGLGYSSLIHSAACLVILQNDGILEPLEGHDVYKCGLFFEITGQNWETRRTNADVIINKYAVICAICADYTDAIETIKLSTKEDSFDSSGFHDSSFDQDRSPYSDIIDRLHEQTRWFDSARMKMLYFQYRSFYSNKPPNISASISTVPDLYEVDGALIRGAKKTDNKFYLPCPFKILAGAPFDHEIGKTLRIRPQITATADRTTFHNMDLHYDPIPILISEPIYKVKPPLEEKKQLTQWMYQSLLKYSIFQSLYIESELFSKVNGKEGCFWSKYSNAGIAWQLIRSNSMTYWCAYYQHTKPDESCGIWACIDPINDIWRSPTFKISLNDMEHAKVLPHRLYTTVSSTLGYCTKQQRGPVVQRIMILASCMKGSTWQTSALAGDMRFITLCSISETGDIKSMVDKAAKKVIQPLSSADTMYIKLLRNFVVNFKDRDKNLTPFIGLPIRFLSLEKDLPSTMMWHMREGNHATDCFKKLARGVLQEIDNRDELVNALNLQSQYIDKMFSDGVSQNDFNNLMQQMPETPYYNHIIFMAMASVSSEKLDIGRRQDPTQTCLVNLVSDHHSTVISNPSKVQNTIISSPRVADGLNQLLSDYDQPEGIHKLVVRMAKGKKLTNIYTIHGKDSKSKNREIPQMANYMRVTQFMCESLLTIYSDGESADMMRNPEKYNEFVTNFSTMMQKGGLTRSEDKEFFCGYMQPECMALCTLVVAITTGSTSIVTAAAIQRTNKSRWTVLPKGCDPEVIDGIKERLSVFIKQGKNIYTSLVIRNYIHMMQGVLAIGAALVNTVFSTGLDYLQKETLPDIEKSIVLTTSDDSVRGVVSKRDSIFKNEQVRLDYINSAPKEMHHCMMLDSTDKPIESPKIAEFNNVATGPTGMFPQQFIHAHLCIQPLLGLSCIEDIVNVVSNSRMSLTWGDSIDLARAAYDANLILLQQKWLLSQDEIDLLKDHGILPDSDEEIIGGFGLMRDTTKLKLLRMLDDESKQFVIEGEMKLIDALRQYRLKPNTKKQKVHKVEYNGPLQMLKASFEQINRSRKVQTKIKVNHIRQFSFYKRIETKNLLMDALMKPQNDATDLEIEMLNSLPVKPTIKIIPTVPRRNNFQPCHMGNNIKIRKDYYIKGIIAYRLLKITISKHLTNEELDVANLNEDEFLKWYLKYKQQTLYEGLSFSSPSGLPLMRIHNNIWYNAPMSFNFRAEVPYNVIEPTNMTIGGMDYTSITPCFYGNVSLTKANNDGCRLAFAYSRVGDMLHIFYQLLPGRPTRYIMNDTTARYVTFYVSDNRIFCPLSKDLTPITDGSFGLTPEKPYNALLVGDSTAMLNYGNYLNTSARSAITRMHTIFKKFESNFPNALTNLKPSYPYFPIGTVEIGYARINCLLGSKSSTKLRLVPQIVLNDIQHIDLLNNIPIVTQNQNRVTEEMWE